MSAPGITYSGVLARKSANESTNESANERANERAIERANQRTNKRTNERANENTRGRVFWGIKFWVSKRIPNYNICIKRIFENDGRVVAREIDADILLCDPAKEPIPGSYSYRLIVNAIEEGSLDTQEDYLCPSIPTSLSTTKSAPKTKQTRNKFTQEEDRLLIRWVNKQASKGMPISGNEIYKDFVTKHPSHASHTWQSWRDRWTKRLSALPHATLSAMGRGPSPQPDAQPDATPDATPEMSRRQEATTKKNRARFTHEEDDILLETIHHAIKKHEPWRGNAPYKRLANELPQRTYISWRERALNYVARHNSDQITQWELDADFHSSDGGEAPRGSIKDRDMPRKEDEVNTRLQMADHRNENATVASLTQPREEHDTHMSDDESGRKEEHQVVASLPLQRTSPPQMSPKEGVPAGSDPPHHSTPVPKFIIPQPLDDEIPITTKEQFYRDYNTFLESTGATNRFIPSVGGKAIALWDLWQSVRSQVEEKVAPDWQQVAEDLGFDWISMEVVPNDLQQCYEEHLAPFADAMMSFNESSDEDSDEDNADADAGTERPFPSSPPMLPSSKLPPVITSPGCQPLSPNPPTKRRRIDRNHVIPSTPENRNEKSHLPLLNNPDKSLAVSPLNEYRAVESISRSLPQSSVMNGEDGEMDDRVAALPAQRQGRKRRLEPETQDFHFDADTQAQMHYEEDNDSQGSPSPSQQLLLESDIVTVMMQHEASGSATPRQRRVHATPSPRRNSNSSGKRRSRESAGAERALTPTPKAHPKPRALPSSWKSKSPTPTAQNGEQSRTVSLESSPPRKSPTPPQETPDDVIDHFISLGYDREIVLRALKATSWIVGNAGQVMEMMKQGGTSILPQRTTGVWTQRDDDALALVFSPQAPADEKEERKRAKEMRRLKAKHGDEQIRMRKTYLLDEVPE